jgi:hypothetical protein
MTKRKLEEVFLPLGAGWETKKSSVGHLEGRQLGQRGCEHQPSTGVARTQEGR